MESLTTLKTSVAELHVKASSWLSGDPKSSFSAWKHRMPLKRKSKHYEFPTLLEVPCKPVI